MVSTTISRYNLLGEKNRKKIAKIWSKLAIFIIRLYRKMLTDLVLHEPYLENRVCKRQTVKKQEFHTDFYFEMSLRCFLTPKNGRTPLRLNISILTY